ncbi:MAG: phosphodiesterase [Solobacterium sp.]|nr:phosphodiesterase [Solobacterium sp.]
MRNYLVISDIHGDKAGAGLIQEAIDLHQPERILLLGDVLYHGPRNDLPNQYDPKAVIAFINNLKTPVTAVRGNCDAEVDQMVLNIPITADYNCFPLGSRTLFLTHGHVYSPEHLPILKAGDLFLYGHTHIPSALQAGGIYLLNPGSVSLPKENHPRSYGLLTETAFTVLDAAHHKYQSIVFEDAPAEL